MHFPNFNQSESEDSETERRKEEERKREEEAKAAEKGKSREDKLPSEVSTPSGRASKHAAPPMQKSASSNSLKRPNSPNASDLSGNESSRKKQKQSHLVSRMSPGPPDSRGRQPSLVGRRLQGAGSGSDTDASANTRRLKKQQQRIALSPNGTPGASRAGSPDATGARESRAGSPAAQQAKKPATTGPMPTTDEILPLLPPEGIAIPALLALFRGRVPKERSKEFFATVKQVAVMHKDTKLVFPKGGKRAGKDSAASPEPASTAAGS
ncbi:MAG: hypothetical protein INR71_04285 [Terriglobus roseus]|nr:hypothetical protein [Terriglobus roseus]